MGPARVRGICAISAKMEIGSRNIAVLRVRMGIVRLVKRLMARIPVKTVYPHIVPVISALRRIVNWGVRETAVWYVCPVRCVVARMAVIARYVRR